MSELPDGETVKEIARWGWANRQAAASAWKSLGEWFRGAGMSPDERGILILGAGGVGKTTLAGILAGTHDFLLDTPSDYEESVVTQTFALENGEGIEVVVAPGQAHRRDTTWPELMKRLAAGEFRGVMLVNAYGYHSLGVSYKAAKQAGSKQSFVGDFTAERRLHELSVLKTVLPHLPGGGVKTWFLTVVTKQDLWADRSDDVRRYYEEGEYGELMREAADRIGRTNFRREFCAASLVISRFRDGRGTVLQDNLRGYDHREQVVSLRRLVETVFALKAWEQ